MGISQFLTVAANTASGNPEPSVGVVVATGLILVFGVLAGNVDDDLVQLGDLHNALVTELGVSEERSGSRSGESGCSEGSGCGSRHPGRGRRGHCRRYRLHGRRRTLYAAQC